MTTHTFEPVSTSATKSLPCPVCRKPVRRRKTFTQTLNPFNRNSDGLPKTRADIRRELISAAQEWVETAETHQGCSA